MDMTEKLQSDGMRVMSTSFHTTGLVSRVEVLQRFLPVTWWQAPVSPFNGLWALQDLNLRPADYESAALTN